MEKFLLVLEWHLGLGHIFKRDPTYNNGTKILTLLIDTSMHNKAHRASSCPSNHHPTFPDSQKILLFPKSFQSCTCDFLESQHLLGFKIFSLKESTLFFPPALG